MNKPPFRRRADQMLPQATAEQILSNVFTACSRERNSIPLEALTAYSNYRKERYAIQRTVILLVLALFLLLPLLFIASGVRIALTNPESGENPVYAIAVDTRLPIRQIDAHISGKTVPLYEISPGSYTAMPRENGELNVSVTLVNRQTTNAVLAVNGVDTDAPQLLSSETAADCVYVHVADAGSGVDYSGVTIVSQDGQIFSPLQIDPQTGRIALPYPNQPLRVRIPDLRGNVLEISLKPQQ